jgi:hypothetical protein
MTPGSAPDLGHESSDARRCQESARARPPPYRQPAETRLNLDVTFEPHKAKQLSAASHTEKPSQSELHKRSSGEVWDCALVTWYERPGLALARQIRVWRLRYNRCQVVTEAFDDLLIDSLQQSAEPGGGDKAHVCETPIKTLVAEPVVTTTKPGAEQI